MRKEVGERIFLFKCIIVAFSIMVVLSIIFFVKLNHQKTGGNDYAECLSDSDCAKVQTTCCSCSSGGEEVCIAKSKAEEVKAKNCPEDLMCIAMYNCKIKNCSCVKNKCIAIKSSKEGSVGIPNPASVYCAQQGGNLEIRKNELGNQYGVCIFQDGSECEEWTFYEGTCKPGENY